MDGYVAEDITDEEVDYALALRFQITESMDRPSSAPLASPVPPASLAGSVLLTSLLLHAVPTSAGDLLSTYKKLRQKLFKGVDTIEKCFNKLETICEKKKCTWLSRARDSSMITIARTEYEKEGLNATDDVFCIMFVMLEIRAPVDAAAAAAGT